MIVGIVGARTRDSEFDYKVTENAFISVAEHKNDVKIISGGADKGGDRFAKIISQKFNIPFNDKDYTPDFSNGYDKNLYFERNVRIAKDSDVLIACKDFNQSSKRGGTNYTIKKFQEFHPNGNLIIV